MVKTDSLKFDVSELHNEKNNLLFRCNLNFNKNSIYVIYFMLSKDEISIREEISSNQNNPSLYLNIPVVSWPTPFKTIKFKNTGYSHLKTYHYFSIDLTTSESIDFSLQKLSINESHGIFCEDINEVLGSQDFKLYDYYYRYIFEFFYKAKPEAYSGKSIPFYKNSLFLLLLDNLIDHSFDDTALSVSCQKIINSLCKAPLGNFLVKRLIFHKYKHLYENQPPEDEVNNIRIRAWENSIKVKVAFIEYFDLLTKDNLEQFYPADYIAFGLSNWFPPPEKEIDLFLQFVDKASFNFSL